MSDVRKIPNTNNKLEGSFFCHIALPPSHSITFDGKPKLHMVTDGFRPPFRAFLVDVFRINFGEVTNRFTLLTDGLPCWEWRKKFKEQYPMITDANEVAIYFFAKDFGSGPPAWSLWDENIRFVHFQDAGK